MKKQAKEAVGDAVIAMAPTLSTKCLEHCIKMQCELVKSTWGAFACIEIEFSIQDEKDILESVESVIRI